MPPQNLGDSPNDQHALALLPEELLREAAELFQEIHGHKEQLFQDWYCRWTSSPNFPEVPSERYLREAFNCYLHQAVEPLRRGDALGFISYAWAMGERVARRGVPFARVVRGDTFLKESCAKVLNAGPDKLCRALFLLDRIHSCLISVAADSYYGWLMTKQPAESSLSDSESAAVAASNARHGAFCGIVGRSPAMQAVYDQILRVVPGTAPVLILGETGTGKELVARAIHACGPHRAGPFIALNCAALPRDLIESELFGHKRGAFSGAVTEYLGLFRAATGGTLFLDEITEMSPDLQAKLLRVLQERTVRPVGSITEQPVDVRIVASSNRDPQAAIAAHALRPDLFYRLSVSTLQLPPLRNHLEDIPHLVEHYLAILNERYGAAKEAGVGIAPTVLDLLGSRVWPGNIRELFNTLEDAFMMCRNAAIDVDDFRSLPAVEEGDNSVTLEFTTATPTFEKMERALIEKALAATGGNKVQAARQLGISRKKLYAKLAKYALQAPLAIQCLVALSGI